MPQHLDQPLSVWYCDECHEAITEPIEGMLVWNDPTDWGNRSAQFQRKLPNEFSIVHKVQCDVRDDTRQSMHLEAMLGVTGLQWWASNLWNGPASNPMIFNGEVDAHAAMDLLYRLQVPYYEQARQYFHSSYASQELHNRSVMSDAVLKEIIHNAGEAL